MKITVGLFLILLSHCCQAQVLQVFKLKPHHKEWSQGPLSWNDFQGTPPPDFSRNSELSYKLNYAPAKLKAADTTFICYRVYGFADTKLSWVQAGERTPEVLKFNQAKFNLLEIHRRLLQGELSAPVRSRDARWLAGRTLLNLKNGMDKLTAFSEGGRNASYLNGFLDSTNHVLGALNPEPRPVFQLNGLGFGTHVGLGHHFFTGNLGEHLTNATGVAHKIEIAYKQAFLNFDFGMTFNEVDKPFSERPGWAKDQQLTMFKGGISLGYAILDKSKIRLVPFAGVAALGIQPREYYFNGINNTSAFYTGVTSDFKFRKRIWLTPSATNPREMADYGLRAQLMVMPAVHYNNSLKGSVISLSLSPYIFTRIVKAKKFY